MPSIPEQVEALYSQIIRFWGFRNVGCFCCSDARVCFGFRQQKEDATNISSQRIKTAAHSRGVSLTRVRVIETGDTRQQQSGCIIDLKKLQAKQLRKGWWRCRWWWWHRRRGLRCTCIRRCPFCKCTRAPAATSVCDSPLWTTHSNAVGYGGWIPCSKHGLLCWKIALSAVFDKPTFTVENRSGHVFVSILICLKVLSVERER